MERERARERDKERRKEKSQDNKKYQLDTNVREAFDEIRSAKKSNRF